MTIIIILALIIIICLFYKSKRIIENFVSDEESNIMYKLNNNLSFTNKLKTNENGGSLKNNIGNFGIAKKILGNKNNTIIITYTSHNNEKGSLLYIPIYSKNNLGNNINVHFSSDNIQSTLTLTILNKKYTYNLGLNNSTYVIAVTLNDLDHSLFVNGIQRPTNIKTPINDDYFFVDMPIIINKNKTLDGDLHSIIVYKRLLGEEELEKAYKYTMKDFLYDDANTSNVEKQEVFETPTLNKKIPIKNSKPLKNCNFTGAKGKTLCDECPDINIDYDNMNIDMSKKCEKKVDTYCAHNYSDYGCNVINTIKYMNEFK